MQEENELIKAALRGDDRCFAILVDRYKDLVMAVAMRVVKNREDAEDLTQEVFVKAYMSLGKFKGDAKFSTWLFRIAYNEAVSLCRQSRLDTTAVEDWMDFEQRVDTGLVTQMENIGSIERSRYIHLAMERMDPKDAMLLTLFYLGENTVAEISDICSMTQTNVKTSLSRARTRMGRVLVDMLGENAANMLLADR